MLHILDGESSAGTLKQTNISGEIHAWADALINGPTPRGLNEAEWRKVRAQHLSHDYTADFATCEASLLAQAEVLDSFRDHEEVVLWFEHDLFCQTNLLYALSWFSNRELGKTKLSLVCINGFPGVPGFRGLGQLDEHQLASLFPARREVSTGQLQLAQNAWDAYCSPDPIDLEKLISRDLSALPFLKRALELHLARFPSVKNGIGRVENHGLSVIAEGWKVFPEVFKKFVDTEPVYGLGDLQFRLELQRLSDASQPLITVSNGSGNGNGLNTSFEITTTGSDVLEGRADFIKLNGIDLWLGGVHLTESNLWRWDESMLRLSIVD